MLKALLLSSLTLNLGLLLGRLSGFAREAFIAASYGATAEADIVVLMLTVPDLLVSILMGGALGAVLVPEFAQNQEKALRLLYQSLLFFGTLFTGVAATLYWQADTLVAVLVPGFIETQAERAAIALGGVIWLIPLTVLAGVATAYLHAQNQFTIAALGTLIINTSIIIGLLLVHLDYGSLNLVALFVLLGGVLRLLSQLLQIRPTWSPLTSLRPNFLNRVLLVRYGQAMLSGSALLLFPVVARALASFQEEGSIALFSYATRLIEFPLAIAVTFLTAILFPRLALSFSTDSILHKRLIHHGIQITLGLSLVAAITLISLSEQYTQVVYGYGDMRPSSLALVETLTSVGLLALPLQGLASFLTAVSNARKNTLLPMLVNVTGLGFFLVVSMAEVFGSGLEALMRGIVASYGLICLLQLSLLKVEALSWRHVFLDKTFLPGALCGIVLLVYTSHWIGQAHLQAWLALALGCFAALLSLITIALFNKEIRTGLKTRLCIND